MKKLLLAVALSLCAMTTAAAQSIAGDWDAMMNTPGGVRNFRILFKQDGEKVSGTVTREQGDSPLTGTIAGGNVKFAYEIMYSGHPITMTMTAVVTGDEMKGQVDIASQMQDAFSAKRVMSRAAVDPQRPAGARR